MSIRRWWLLALAAVAVVLLVGRVVSGMYVEYRWYEAMGALPVWRTRTITTTLLRLLSGLAASAFIFANLYAVRRTVVSLRFPRRMANIEIAEEVPARYLLGAVIALSVIFGALVTVRRENWIALTLARTGIAFGETDPRFRADLGFFVYWLPFERELFYWVLITVLLVTVLVIFLYALTPSLHWERGTLHISNYVRRHLLSLVAVLLLVLAWSYRLDAYKVLLSGSGEDGMVTYADYHARIPLNLALWVITMGAAIILAAFGWTGQVRAAFGSVIAVLLLGVLLRQLAPPLVQRFAQPKDPAARERPYVATRTLYTRRAYAADRIRSADPELGFLSRERAGSVIAVWDNAALARWMSLSRQGDGTTHAIGMLARRDGLLATIVSSPVQENPGARPSRSWTASYIRASLADERGDPVRVSPLGVPADEALYIEQPIVYDSARGYLLLADSAGRMLASGLSSGLSRLIHAWSFQNFRLLFGDLPHPNPVLFARRDLRERVRAIAPFFVQGTAITPLLHGDTVFWVLDMYSASGSYPVSRMMPFGHNEYRYLQHAATAVTNSRTGRVIMVPDSALDPIARTWVRLFPTLFTTWERVPASLVNDMPPAIDGARMQAAILARYGGKGDTPRRGTLPVVEGADSGLVSADAPFMAIPRSGGVTAWSIPVLEENGIVAGLLVALGGAERQNFWVGTLEDGIRWSSVLDRLQRLRDTTVALTRDMNARRGAVRVIPIADGVTFLQSTYDWRIEGPPALIRVSALTRDSLRVGRTLSEALGIAPAAARETEAPLTGEAFRARVEALYSRMREALQRDDLSAFAEAYRALGTLLARTPR